MFKYLHGYHPDVWDAVVEQGIFRKGDGIRFCNTILLEDEKLFNNLAKKGGKFWNFVKENDAPLYIDRLQGGTFFFEYEFDKQLLADYKELLGDKFLGFQMHEWISNYVQDIRRLTINSELKEWTEQAITEEIFRQCPYNHLMLEAVNAKEMYELGKAESVTEFIQNCIEIYKRRQNFTDGMLIPADSYCMAPKLEIELGTKRLMPEIGAQIRNTRLQIAYTRGMAKAAGIEFGTYYEPWGGSPVTACCYQRDDLNEWNIGGENFPFQTQGENGGSSRSLQKRLHLYSFLAGAQFMAEEWGVCNLFYDWKSFELSPYGKVKKEFLDFTDKYKTECEQVTPAAVVLPKDLPIVTNARFEERLRAYQPGLTYIARQVEGEFADKLKVVNEGIEKIFCASSEMCGNEKFILINSPVADAFDIIHEDNIEALEKYDILVDLTSNPEFAKAHKVYTPDEAIAKINEYLPCSVEGNAHWFVTKLFGKDHLVIINNDGVDRTLERGDYLMPEGTHTLVIDTKGKKLCVKENEGNLTEKNGKYVLELCAGAFFLAELE